MGKRQKEARKKNDDSAQQVADGPGRDWADNAAQARTADDPQAVAPRDAVGTPSTGDAR